MDQEQTFYSQQPVDTTPYASFVWVIALAVIITAVLGYGVWRLGSWAKRQQIGLNHSGATDAYLNKVEEQGSSVLDQASNAAQKAADDAAAAATQQLLQQQNAAIKSGTDAAKNEVKTQADQQIQQFINQ